jgi:hypothetical protein
MEALREYSLAHSADLLIMNVLGTILEGFRVIFTHFNYEKREIAETAGKEVGIVQDRTFDGRLARFRNHCMKSTPAESFA